MNCKIALVMVDDFAVWHFRKGLITALKDCGVDVYVVCPAGPYVSRIEGLGAKFIPVPMNRFPDLWGDVKLILALYRVFRREKFDIVHNMTIKPNIYGAFAARLAGVRRVVALVAGLGYTFAAEHSWRRRLLRWAVSLLYWLGLKLSDRVWFQNEEDLAYFRSIGIVSSKKAVLIRSGGINLNEYSPEAVDPVAFERLKSEISLDHPRPIVVMMVARLIRSKGVVEFVEASRIVGNSHPRVLFLLVGPLVAGSPDSVTSDFLHKYLSPNFTHLGFREDVREILHLADVVVLPSYYREGVPRGLLEAMAMEKPIVTTDNVGCREVVDEGKNGYLIPVRDSAALASAVEILVNDSDLRSKFGFYSRVKAGAEFDEAIVVKRILTEVYGINQAAINHEEGASLQPITPEVTKRLD